MPSPPCRPVSQALSAQAKINLGLRVLPRITNGYHDVLSVMCSISLADAVTVELRPRESDEPRVLSRMALDLPEALSRTEDLPVGPANIANRAASLFLEHWPLPESTAVSIDLVKRIPSRVGLAGGSSDAAAVLRALSTLTALGDPDRDILHSEVAVRLGSDVPFFLRGGVAHAAGRGDRLTPIPFQGSFRVVLLVDAEIRIPTPRAYALLDGRRRDSLTAGTPPAHYSPPEMLEWPEGSAFPLDLGNDFLPVVLDSHPRLHPLVDFLEDAASGAWGLSGKGPAFYALFRNDQDAKTFASRVPRNHHICVIQARSTGPVVDGASSNW